MPPPRLRPLLLLLLLGESSGSPISARIPVGAGSRLSVLPAVIPEAQTHFGFLETLLSRPFSRFSSSGVTVTSREKRCGFFVHTDEASPQRSLLSLCLECSFPSIVCELESLYGSNRAPSPQPRPQEDGEKARRLRGPHPRTILLLLLITLKDRTSFVGPCFPFFGFYCSASAATPKFRATPRRSSSVSFPSLFLLLLSCPKWKKKEALPPPR